MRHVIAYLFRDTLKRWVEQPWSPLARVLVAFLVAGAALAVLGVFDAAENVVVAKMRNLGVNTIVVVRPVKMGERADGSRYEWLSGQGSLLVLDRPYFNGLTRTGLPVELCGYAPESLPALAKTLGVSGGVVGASFLLTDSIPAGISETVRLPDGMVFDCVSIKPAGVLRLVPRQARGGLLLVPVASVEARVFASGGNQIVVFERDEAAAVSLADCVTGVRRLAEMENTQERVTSSLDLSRELANVRETKRLWTAVLCGLFGVTLVLVFGAMAGLEYRESRFLAALLRSMGARPWLLVARQAAESAVVANLGGFAAVAALEAAARNSASIAALGVDAAQFAVSAESATAVFGGLCVGAIAAAVPVALALRKPIGVVLG